MELAIVILGAGFTVCALGWWRTMLDLWSVHDDAVELREELAMSQHHRSAHVREHGRLQDRIAELELRLAAIHEQSSPSASNANNDP